MSSGPTAACAPAGRARWIDPAVGAACGAAVAVVAVSLSRFAGHGDLVRGIGGDAGSSFASLRYFVNDRWHLPLLSTASMTGPSGAHTVVAFTDGIPLLALLAKCLRFLGISVSQWIAAWYVGCVVMQGLAAGVVGRVFRIRRWWLVVTFALFAATAPVLLFRSVHPGLFAQFVLLLAWAFAGNHWRNPSWRSLAWGCPLLVLALLIHPYLFVMTAVVVIGVGLSAVTSRSVNLRDAVAVAGVTVMVILIFMVSLGYLPNNAVPAGGYGAFGMPLLSPIFPQGSGLWPGARAFITNSSGSTEGFNYLGSGVVVLTVAAVVIERHRLGAFLLRQQCLVVLLGGLTAFAVSPVLYVAGSKPLRPFGATLPAVLSPRGLALMGLVGSGVLAIVGTVIIRARWWDRLRPGLITAGCLVVGVTAIAVVDRSLLVEFANQFRSSGRFFWVIGYGVTIAVVVLLDGAVLRERVLVGLVAVALAMQLVDVRLFVAHSGDRLLASPVRTADLDAVVAVMRHHTRVHLASDWACVVGPGGLVNFQDVVIAASLADVPIDNYYGGRAAPPKCPTQARSDRDPAALTVVVTPSAADLTRVEAAGLQCRGFRGDAFCSRRWADVTPAGRARFTAGVSVRR